jgi:hypothetical protein
MCVTCIAQHFNSASTPLAFSIFFESTFMQTFLRRGILLGFVLVAIIGGLNACTVITTETQTTALTRPGGWKFDSFVGTPPVSYSTLYPGGSIKFTSDSWTFTNGPLQLAGTWSWPSLTTLKVTPQGGTISDEWNVVELTATAMRWSGTFNGSTFEMKWTAQ